MSWSIKPFHAVGPLSFGQKRESVRTALGADYDSFAKVQGANLTDAYDALGVHLYYDDDDSLEFVELFEPAVVDYVGKPLLGKSFSFIQQELTALGYSGTPTDVGYDYKQLGIAFTLGEDKVEGVGAFRRGYYDCCPRAQPQMSVGANAAQLKRFKVQYA